MTSPWTLDKSGRSASRLTPGGERRGKIARRPNRLNTSREYAMSDIWYAGQLISDENGAPKKNGGHKKNGRHTILYVHLFKDYPHLSFSKM